MSRGSVLITGSSSGIGEALARVFSAEGFDLILTARRTSNLEALKTELEGSGPGRVDVITADIGHLAGIKALCDEVDNRELKVDVLVNNAGTMPETSFQYLSDEDIAMTLGLNIDALTYLTRHFLTGMIARGSGRILNVASVAAFHPVPGMDIYAATKAYVLSLSESLSESLKGTGVSVTTLCPGLTRTDMVDESISRNMPPFMVSSAEEVAQEGFAALMAREAIRIPGMGNQAAVTWAQFQPRWLIRGLGGLAARFTGPR